MDRHCLVQLQLQVDTGILVVGIAEWNTGTAVAGIAGRNTGTVVAGIAERNTGIAVVGIGAAQFGTHSKPCCPLYPRTTPGWSGNRRIHIR
jgi:hypothetical protein